MCPPRAESRATPGSSSSCQTAIVFLTDGNTNVGAGTAEVSLIVSLVSTLPYPTRVVSDRSIHPSIPCSVPFRGVGSLRSWWYLLTKPAGAQPPGARGHTWIILALALGRTNWGGGADMREQLYLRISFFYAVAFGPGWLCYSRAGAKYRHAGHPLFQQRTVRSVRGA